MSTSLRTCVFLWEGELKWRGRGKAPLQRGWASHTPQRPHTDRTHCVYKALPQELFCVLLTRSLRGSNVGTVLQVKTGIQPHPVTLHSSCSDLVPYRQDRFPDPGSCSGGTGVLRELPWTYEQGDWGGECKVRHLVASQKPEEGLSSHSFHGSEEPGLRLRSRAAMLPWKQRVPLSLTAGITVIGVGVGRGCFPGSTKGWG